MHAQIQQAPSASLRHFCPLVNFVWNQAQHKHAHLFRGSILWIQNERAFPCMLLLFALLKQVVMYLGTCESVKLMIALATEADRNQKHTCSKKVLISLQLWNGQSYVSLCNRTLIIVSRLLGGAGPVWGCRKRKCMGIIKNTLSTKGTHAFVALSTRESFYSSASPPR